MDADQRPDDPAFDEPAWDDLDARASPPDGPGPDGWWHPPYEVRVVLVGAVWAVAGMMYGLLAGVFAAGLLDPFAAAAVVGVIFAAAGGWLEASG